MDKIYLEDMVVRFSQGPDCCQKDDESQIIEIHSEDNGVGTFFWFKTDRWSFSEPDDLVKLAERVRAMEETNNKYENGEVIYNNSTDDKSVNNNIKQTEYVDLGLPSGLKWAKCNVGAKTETDYGDYFQWGEIEPHDADTPYDWANYKYGDGWNFSKYNTLTLCGETPDGKTTLDLEDDAARANMGGEWRMPTKDEFQELLDNTTNEWVIDFNGSGVNGMKFISKADATKYIFIPASGSCSGSSLRSQGSSGYVWCSSLNSIYPNYAWNLYFDSVGFIVDCDDIRKYGVVVRGVMD